MAGAGGGKFLYGELTWPEIREAARADRVIMLPVGSVEDHGLHLPVDTDNRLNWELCLEVARRLPHDVLLMPLVPYGFETHHLDFPGPIAIDGDAFMGYLLGITRSLAHHGFKRIVILNSHGSNRPFVEIVARRTVIDTGVLCVATGPYEPGWAAIEALRRSEPGRGIAHACEFETSVYLYLAPDLVQMDRAVKEWGLQTSAFFRWDNGPSPVEFMDWWSRFSRSGVVGDPTVASADTGRRMFEAAAAALVEFIREFKTWELRDRVDHH